jgi:hypothetical protein
MVLDDGLLDVGASSTEQSGLHVGVVSPAHALGHPGHRNRMPQQEAPGVTPGGPGSLSPRCRSRHREVCLFEIVGREGGGVVGSVSRTRADGALRWFGRVGGGQGLVWRTSVERGAASPDRHIGDGRQRARRDIRGTRVPGRSGDAARTPGSVCSGRTPRRRRRSDLSPGGRRGDPVSSGAGRSPSPRQPTRSLTRSAPGRPHSPLRRRGRVDTKLHNLGRR